ncbi:hypothetical protein PG997_009716 [Apiospora hydei]|uniref:Uncharacterized protein n=1 Tax=Apiospora hydei TaxID=1337664 RepID=A0ABR1VUY3_9PEZI
MDVDKAEELDSYLHPTYLPTDCYTPSIHPFNAINAALHKGKKAATPIAHTVYTCRELKPRGWRKGKVPEYIDVPEGLYMDNAEERMESRNHLPPNDPLRCAAQPARLPHPEGSRILVGRE